MTMAEVAKKGNIKGTTKASTKNKEKKEKILPLTKVIIRRLPPTMRKETFIEQISPIPDYDYFYFVDADRTLGVHSFCRAYINFINADDIFMFKEKFDNYIFVDNRGNEFGAVVEYAPYQGVPKRKSPKPDPKCGTIETDPQYKIFLENFKAEEIEASKQDIKTGLSCHIKDTDKKVTTTPLLEYVAARRLEKLKAKAERKEERRKKDLERKKLKDEERKKKKTEENKSKQSVVTEELSDETSSLKEEAARNSRPKTGKLFDFTASGSGGSSDRGTTSRTIYNKFSRDSGNFKGKNFKEKRYEDSYKKPYEDKKVDSKYKYRDDKFRSFEPEGRYKKQEFKNNFGRDRKRDDERRYSGRSDSKDNRRYDCRRSQIEKPAPEPVLREVKKYSETRREREAHRQESRRLAEQYKSSLLNAAAAAAAAEAAGAADATDATNIVNDENVVHDNADERVSAELPLELVKDSVESKMDEVDKLAESLEQKVNIVEQALTDNIEIDNSQDNHDKFDHTECIEKPETDDSVLGKVKHFPEPIICESSTDADYTPDNITDTTEYVSDTENRKHNSDRKFYFDRRDPRAERRIRNKDRPSMAIYQPGKARLIQIKETPLTTATTINDSFDKKSKIDD